MRAETDTTSLADLPRRSGPLPQTTTTNPQTQLDQQPTAPFSRELLAAGAQLAGVTLGPSNRAPIGTVGLHLRPGDANGPEDAFLLRREFAHVHPGPDHSLHMILPEPLRQKAIEAGWALSHPMAGMPTVSPLTVLIFAPRDEGERDFVIGLIEASWAHAAGRRPADLSERPA